MATHDMPVLISRVCETTGFKKVSLVAHSQATTQTLTALCKHFTPELGVRPSIACLLTPAIYAEPLLQTWVFRAFGLLSHDLWHWFLGIHAFIQSMIAHMGILSVRLFGLMGYVVFNYMFKWSVTGWDRDLRNRGFCLRLRSLVGRLCGGGWGSWGIVLQVRDVFLIRGKRRRLSMRRIRRMW
jgi:hypothetical protein